MADEPTPPADPLTIAAAQQTDTDDVIQPQTADTDTDTDTPTTDDTAPPTTPPNAAPSESSAAIADAISAETFTAWHRQHDFATAIQDGNDHYQTAYTPAPEKHTPSRLLECHRKRVYNQENAPEEDDTPVHGIFWHGDGFERDLIIPYLTALAQHLDGTYYVKNDMRARFDIALDDTTLTVSGKTDPVICDQYATPVLPTEVKTKSEYGFKALDDDNPEPDPRHKAQLHAYLFGLSHQYNCEISTGLVIYACRKTHQIKPITVEFDPDFWTNTVVDWMATHTHYRLANTETDADADADAESESASESESATNSTDTAEDAAADSQATAPAYELPPADPEFPEWECDYCPYRSRCGQSDAPWDDLPPTGFLPRTQYARPAVEDHLTAHFHPDTPMPPLATLTDALDTTPPATPAATQTTLSDAVTTTDAPPVALTPTLAHHYPDLADQYPVYDWTCPNCEATFAWDAFDWDGDSSNAPSCPDCDDATTANTLRGPMPPVADDHPTH